MEPTWLLGCEGSMALGSEATRLWGFWLLYRLWDYWALRLLGSEAPGLLSSGAVSVPNSKATTRVPDPEATF